MALSKPNLGIFERPECLVGSGAGSEVIINNEVLAQLQKLDKPVVVVAIAGIYRTGKSYLMNRLAGKSSGFSLGATIQSNTKGIWIWATQHPLKSDQYLLLLDTEGLGDAKKGDPNHDNWLFCLATLLASTLVYNILGAINEDALAKLNFVSEMSKHIKVKENGSSTDDSEFDAYFPKFVFTVRDFTLELVIEGREVTPSEYMEDCLKCKKDDGTKQTKEYNLPRQSIRRYFKHRRCFTFDRPCNRKLLKTLDDLDLSELSEDFREDLQKFLDFINSESPVKTLEDGTELNGRMFATLVSNYVEAIQNGVLPCIENAVVSMAAKENTRNVEEAFKIYVAGIEDRLKLPTPDNETLGKIHSECLSDALSFFMSKIVCDKDQAFQKELNIRIEDRHMQLVKENDEASRKKCKAVLEELNVPIETKLNEGKYAKPGGYAEYQDDVNELENQYQEKKDLGIMREEEIRQYLKEKRKEGQGVLAIDKNVSDQEKKAEAERQKTLDAQRELKAAEEKRKLMDEIAVERQKAYEENVERLDKHRREEMENIKQHNEEMLILRQREADRLKKEGMEEGMRRLMKEMADMKDYQRTREIEFERETNRNRDQEQIKRELHEVKNKKSCVIQ